MAQGSGGYGGPNFSQIEGSLRNVALQFATIASLQQQIAASVNTWRQLERELTLANAAAGGTRAEFQRMEQAARNFALVSTFSASQVANAFYNLASAGFSVGEALRAANGVLLLSSATLTDLGEASDVVSSTLNQFNLTAGETYRVSNLFVAATNTSLATLPKLAFALRQVGPIASNTGMSIEETVTALDRLFQAGLRGEQAGTALRNSIVRIMNPVGQGSLILQNLGVKTFDERTGAARQFLDVMRDIAQLNLSGNAITQIFGTEAAAGATALLNSLRRTVGQTTDEFERHLREISNTDWAYRQAVQQMNTLDGSLANLGNHFNDFRIQLGQALVPIISSVANILKDLSYEFQHMTGEQKLAVVQMVLMVAQFGLITKFLTTAVGGFANLSRNMERHARLVERIRVLNDGAGMSFGQVAQRASSFGRVLGGLASTGLGLIGVGATIWGIVEAMKAANREATRLREQNVGGNILDAAARRQNITGPNREMFTDMTDVSQPYVEESSRLFNRVAVDPNSKAGSFELFRMMREQISRGQQEVQRLNQQIDEFQRNGRELANKMNETGQLVQDMFSNNWFVRLGHGGGRSLGTASLDAWIAGNVANDNRGEATRQLNEWLSLEGKTLEERRRIMMQIAQRREQSAQAILDNMDAGSRASNMVEVRSRVEQMYRLARTQNDAAFTEMTDQAVAAAKYETGKLSEWGEIDARASYQIIREFSNQFGDLVETNMMGGEELVQSLITKKEQERNSILASMRQLQQRSQGIDSDISTEMVSFIQEIAQMNDHDKQLMMQWIQTPQGRQALEEATRAAMARGGDMRQAGQRLMQTMIDARLGFQADMTQGIRDYRAIMLVNRRELETAIRDNDIKYLELQRDIARLGDDPSRVDQLTRQLTRQINSRETGNAASEFFAHLTQDEQGRTQYQRLVAHYGSEERLLTAFQRRLREYSQGDASARQRIIETVGQYYQDQVGNLPLMVDEARGKLRNADAEADLSIARLEQDQRQETERRTDEASRRAQQRSREYARTLERILGLPSAEDVYLAIQDVRLSIQERFNQYFQLTIEPIRDEMNRAEYTLRERLRRLETEYEGVFTDTLADGLENTINNADLRDAFSGRILQRIRQNGSAEVFGRTFTREMIQSAEGINDLVRHVTQQFANVINAEPDLIGGPERIAAFERMFRAMIDQMGSVYDDIGAQLEVARDRFRRAENQVREYAQEFNNERLVREFENAVALSGPRTSQHDIEILVDVAVRARTARVILDIENARKQMRERYEQIFRNLGINVTINPQTGRIERANLAQTAAAFGRTQPQPLPNAQTQPAAVTVNPQQARQAGEDIGTAAARSFRDQLVRTSPLNEGNSPRRIPIQGWQIGDGYGARRHHRDGSGHQGVDIFAPNGTGFPMGQNYTIDRSYNNGTAGGNTSVVRLDDGSVWLAMHQPGRPAAGRYGPTDRVLRSGSSGNADVGAEHIHWQPANDIARQVYNQGREFTTRYLMGMFSAGMQGPLTTPQGVDAVRNMNNPVPELPRHDQTAEQRAAQEEAFANLMEQYRRENEALDQLQERQLTFIRDRSNAELLAMKMIRDQREQMYNELYGVPDAERLAQAQSAQTMQNERLATARGRVTTGQVTGGAGIEEFQRQQQATDLAALMVERQERINRLRHEGFLLGIDTTDQERAINEEYERRARLIGDNIEKQREALQATAQMLQDLAHSNGNDPADVLTGLRAALVSFAAEVPTIFETMRDTALMALNGIAEVGAGIITGSEQNVRQAVANILRGMAQLMIKMVIMWGLVQLLRAIPGGSAILAVMDMGAKVGVGGSAKGGTSFAPGNTQVVDLFGWFGKKHADGGMFGYPGAPIMTHGERRAGGVRGRKNAAISIFGEGDYPEAYVPMMDRRSIPVSIDDDGNAYVPLPSGQTIPVTLNGNVGGMRVKKYAKGGVNGHRRVDNVIKYDPARARRADDIFPALIEAVARHRSPGGSGAVQASVRSEQHNTFHIPITIQGDASENDADRIGREVAKQVSAVLTARENEFARQNARRGATNQAGYGVR